MSKISEWIGEIFGILLLVTILVFLILFTYRKPPFQKVCKPFTYFPKKGSFNYKIRQRMRQKNYPPIYTTMADKYAVRDYVNSKGTSVKLAKLLHVTDNPETIPFEKLPNEYVIKANHGSGWIMVIKEGFDYVSEKNYTPAEIIAKCKKWLKITYGKFIIFNERHYWPIKPKIVVEELIKPNNDKDIVPIDYIFYVYHGVVRFIEVHTKRYINHIQNFYTREWEKLHVVIGEPISDEFDPKPENFDELIAIAEKLGEDVDFVRVDLFSVDNDIYFGELTLIPGSGTAKFVPEEYDMIFGQYW